MSYTEDVDEMTTALDNIDQQIIALTATAALVSHKRDAVLALEWRDELHEQMIDNVEPGSERWLAARMRASGAVDEALEELTAWAQDRLHPHVAFWMTENFAREVGIMMFYDENYEKPTERFLDALRTWARAATTKNRSWAPAHFNGPPPLSEGTYPFPVVDHDHTRGEDMTVMEYRPATDEARVVKIPRATEETPWAPLVDTVAYVCARYAHGDHCSRMEEH